MTSLKPRYATVGMVVDCFCRATGYKATPVEGALVLKRDDARIIISVDWKGRACVLCCSSHYSLW